MTEGVLLESRRELPDWACAAAAQVVRAVDAGTYARGRSYADRGHVLDVRVVGAGDGLFAAVRGTGRHPYHVMIHTRSSARSSSRGWSGSCTCPVDGDCKHIVAVLLRAEREACDAWPAAAAERAPQPSAWQRVLDPVAGVAPADARAPVALSLEWQGSDPLRGRVLLQPVRRGARGGWVRAGMQWGQLAYGRWEAGSDAATRALTAIHRAADAGSGRTRWSTVAAADRVYLDELGAQAAVLLAAAVGAGVALVTPGQLRVHVESVPARVGLDVRRHAPGEASGLVVEPVLSLAGAIVRLPDAGLHGSPPTTALLRLEPEGLRIAGIEQPGIDVEPILRAGALTVPADEVERFETGYLPVLARRLEVGSSDGSYVVPEPPAPRVWLEAAYGQGHRLTLTWGVGYGSGPAARLGLRGDEAVRDPRAEAAVLQRVAERVAEVVPRAVTIEAPPGPSTAIPVTPRVLHGMETARFTAEVMPLLDRDPEVDVAIVGEPVDYRVADGPPLVRVGIEEAADGSTDWFDLDIRVEVGGEEVPFRPLFTALAEGRKQLLLDSGTWFDLDRAELEQLRCLIEEARALQDDDGPLRLTRWHAGVWDELTELGVVTAQCEAWRAAVAGLLDGAAREPCDPPTGLRATLRPYQLDGYRWLSYLLDHGLGGVLADDMGLGKTVQALATVLRLKEAGRLDRPALVVAPTSVIATWVGEAARFTPDLRVTAVTQTLARRGRAIADIAAAADVVVTSYAIARLDPQVADERWSTVYLDEAQAVKNPHAKTHQVIRGLDAAAKIAITGTPLENSLTDLWALLAISAPGLFPRLSSFGEVYRKPIESGADPQRLARLQRRVRPLMLRRTKESVAPELPPKQEQIVSIELSTAHRRVYDRHLARERQRVLGMLDDVDRNRIAIFRALTTLRQLSLAPGLVDAAHAGVPSAKVEAFAEQIAAVAAEGHRALVFSQFTGFLRLVRERLDREGIAYGYLDGRTRDRPRRIAEFREGDDPVFLISLKAGGFGLTLTEADYVFLLDPWWNPAAEQQAIDRTHRIGQAKTVMVYRLIAADTIEEKVVALQERKRELFARVVDGGGAIDGALTPDDIRGLLDV